MIMASLTQHEHYAKMYPSLATAFRFLMDHARMSLPDGRHEIDSDRAFALCSSYQTRDPGTFEPEAHRKYLDVQYLISGQETILWTPLDETGPEVAPYDANKDITFYQRNARSRPIELGAGHFAIFFPLDAHQPGCHVDGPGAVKKVVVKIAV